MLKHVFNAVSNHGGRRKLTTFIFHRVHAQRDPLFPFDPDAHGFERRMRWISRWFNVLAAPDAVLRLEDGTLPERAACLTFDDGYADNIDVALPILRRMGVKATFFIATAYLDGGAMWNDRIIEAIRRCTHDRLVLTDLGLGEYPLGNVEQRTHAIEALITRAKYLEHDERETVAEQILQRANVNMPRNLMMRSDDVRQLRAAGMTVGAHTHSHPILARLDAQSAEREIVLGRERLASLIQEPITLFAYPNGRRGEDYTPEHVAIVRRLGFVAAFSTVWGVADRDSDPFQLPRFTPWNQDKWRFGLRLVRNYAYVARLAA